MIRKRLLGRMACNFVVALCMFFGLLGGERAITTRAQELTDIGNCGSDDEETLGEFVDEIDSVDASYTAVTGIYDFRTAYEILDIVNQYRTAAGINPLVMDKDLIDAAMFRSAETKIVYYHTRPNGESCYSVCNKACGENIVCGYGDASLVMDAWMNSESHRSNIMDPYYTSVGIGVMVIGGKGYYVQLFGCGDVKRLDGIPNNQTVTVNVPMTVDAATVIPNVTRALELPTYKDTETIFPNTDVTTTYRTHIQSYGWSDEYKDGVWETNGEISGSLGLSKRLEGIVIDIEGNGNLDIRYKTHIQSYGWEKEWVTGGNISGTVGKGKRLEAIKIELTGSDADKYDVYYRVHAQSYGWLGWAKNGECAGTAGQSKRLEAIQVIVVPKGKLPSGIVGYSYVEVGKSAENTSSSGLINYMTHVQTYGDQSYVYDGSVAGTFGESKRLESIKINLNNDTLGYSGGVRYTTHVQTYGWTGNPEDSSEWKMDGATSGTSGESKRLEAICIQLYGEVADYYDVYYRVHAQTFGWLGWAKNGAPAGTAGYSKRLEGIQIVLLPKGSAVPTANPGSAGVATYISK